MIEALCAVAFVAAAATLAVLVILHARQSKLSFVKDPVSAYGISQDRSLYRAQTMCTGVSATALALALLEAGLPGMGPAIFMLFLLAVSRLVISWFPMTAPGEKPTRIGVTHNLLAFCAFAGASIGALMLADGLSLTPALQEYAEPSRWFGWAATIASAVTVLSLKLPRRYTVFGLAERLIYVAMLGWLGWSALALSSLPLP